MTLSRSHAVVTAVVALETLKTTSSMSSSQTTWARPVSWSCTRRAICFDPVVDDFRVVPGEKEHPLGFPARLRLSNDLFGPWELMTPEEVLEEKP